MPDWITGYWTGDLHENLYSSNVNSKNNAYIVYVLHLYYKIRSSGYIYSNDFWSISKISSYWYYHKRY